LKSEVQKQLSIAESNVPEFQEEEAQGNNNIVPLMLFHGKSPSFRYNKLEAKEKLLQKEEEMKTLNRAEQFSQHEEEKEGVKDEMKQGLA